MPKESYFFLLALSFLSGIIYASLGLSILFSFIPAAIVFAYFYSKNTGLVISIIAAILIVIGCVYYSGNNYLYKKAQASLPVGEIQGTISSDPKITELGNYFLIKTNYGKLAVQTSSAGYSYGDKLQISGQIKNPNPYEISQKILGDFKNPKIKVLETHKGNFVLSFLFNLKHKIGESYQKYLPPQQSAFLFGIIFGTTQNLSPDFIKNLERSGLRFITAIDGLHMQIVILILLLIFNSFLSRKKSLILTVVFVFLFIALTGFTISGLRAGIMAFIAGFTKETNRTYLPHNVLALVAIILTLFNPNVLIFDAGFQLSFLAVIGIIYFQPLVADFLHIKGEGFLAWKESLLIVLSVQIATLPIIITQFQNYSLTSFISSILVVWTLPYLIMAGFLLAALSLIYPLALILSYLVSGTINYIIIVVNLFSHLALSFNPEFGFISVAAYYSLLVLLMYRFYNFKEAKKSKIHEFKSV